MCVVRCLQWCGWLYKVTYLEVVACVIIHERQCCNSGTVVKGFCGRISIAMDAALTSAGFVA